VKLTQKQLRGIIKEAVASRRKALNEEMQQDLALEIENNPEIEPLVHELASHLVEYLGNDPTAVEVDGMSIVTDIFSALARIVSTHGDVKSDEGPPPLPR